MAKVPDPNVDLSVDFRPIRSRLTRAIGRLCPSWLASERDDLVQTACMRLMDRLAHREENAPLSSSYIWKVAFSVTVDEIRKVRRRPEAPISDEVVQRAGRDIDPEQSTRWRETGRSIVSCLGGLSMERRLAVTAHLQGHSIKESARLLGWTAKKYENLMYRGLDDLRRCLSAKGIEG